MPSEKIRVPTPVWSNPILKQNRFYIDIGLDLIFLMIAISPLVVHYFKRNSRSFHFVFLWLVVIPWNTDTNWPLASQKVDGFTCPSEPELMSPPGGRFTSYVMLQNTNKNPDNPNSVEFQTSKSQRGKRALAIKKYRGIESPWNGSSRFRRRFYSILVEVDR